MNEYIVKMEMPESHCPVRFSITATGYCLIADRHGCDLDVTKERPDWCPIICSLPEGHGKLVDADAFIRTIRPPCEDDKFMACTFETVKRLMIENIGNAPTIVPADTAENGKI